MGDIFADRRGQRCGVCGGWSKQAVAVVSGLDVDETLPLHPGCSRHPGRLRHRWSAGQPAILAHMATGSTRAVIAAMTANAGIAVAKFVAYVVTGSASMLAESIHSVADTANQGLLLLGGRRAKRVADDRHQFGYGRERYFWAFVVAMVLFALGGLFSIYEAIEKIRHPHELSSLGWAIGVLVFGIVVEAFSFRVAIIEASRVKGNKTWWEFIRRSRSPELPVVLLEDAGAMIGLVLALFGVGLTSITGDPIWDALGTLCIGILLVIISITLTIEMKSLLIGEAATDEDILALTAAVQAAPSVVRVIDMRTQHIGPEEILVAAKLEFDHSLTNPQLSDAIDEVESALRHAVPHDMQIYLEPDLYDADYREGSDGAEH
ncbi:MAG TPA: cation diffusion facilitator family transporter [Acidimicrobiia bacterium]|nr:cation diffusion facilitator family transporter [Acidimicrobiia bacterium]